MTEQNLPINNIYKEGMLKLIYLNGSHESNFFDSKYKLEIESVAEELTLNFNHLVNVINKEGVSKEEIEIASIFWNSFNNILASLNLFRTGFLHQSPVLLRNAIEEACTAFDFYLDNSKLDAYRKGNYSSTRSITVAKKIDPEIGKWWGGLSGLFSHVSLIHSLPQGTSTGHIIVGGVYDPSEGQLQVTALSTIFITIDKVASICEYVHASNIDDKRYWENKDGNLISTGKHPAHERAVLLFRRIIEAFPNLKKDLLNF